MEKAGERAGKTPPKLLHSTGLTEKQKRLKSSG
jgi:hypothetical protein